MGTTVFRFFAAFAWHVLGTSRQRDPSVIALVSRDCYGKLGHEYIRLLVLGQLGESCLFPSSFSKGGFSGKGMMIGVMHGKKAVIALVACLASSVDAVAWLQEPVKTAPQNSGTTQSKKPSAVQVVARLADEGSSMQDEFIRTNDYELLASKYTQWLSRASRILEDVADDAAAIQFKNAHGNALMGCPNGRNVIGCGYWQEIRGKIDFLMQLINHLSAPSAQVIRQQSRGPNSPNIAGNNNWVTINPEAPLPNVRIERTDAIVSGEWRRMGKAMPAAFYNVRYRITSDRNLAELSFDLEFTNPILALEVQHVARLGSMNNVTERVGGRSAAFSLATAPDFFNGDEIWIEVHANRPIKLLRAHSKQTALVSIAEEKL